MNTSLTETARLRKQKVEKPVGHTHTHTQKRERQQLAASISKCKTNNSIESGLTNFQERLWGGRDTVEWQELIVQFGKNQANVILKKNK